MKKALLLLTSLLIVFSVFAQEKKEIPVSKKDARYELAKTVLSNKIFGILPDDNRTAFNKKNFMGIENEKLILQGVFARQDERFVCDIQNYILKEDKNGNIVVTFDFSGRIVKGNFVISMAKGDNYAEIIETIIISKTDNTNNYMPKPVKLFGEILPASMCEYLKIPNEI